MNQSPLLNNSPTKTTILFGQSHLKPVGQSMKKRVATLMITSLVDAFSILVIYLLFGPAITGESVDPQLGLNLPIAYQSQLTDQENVLVIKNNRFILNTKDVSESNLLNELKKSATTLTGTKKNSLVIVADKGYDVEKLNPVLIAASEAGLNQLRLAVEHQGE